MTPTIQDGDLVAVTEVGLGEVEVGDILAVRYGELKIVHRLVEKLEGDLFRLKGDGNERPDQILYEESQIMGKVVAVYPISDIYTPSYGYASLLVAGILLAISLWKRPNVDLDDVLLSLIIALNMGGIISLRGGA